MYNRFRKALPLRVRKTLVYKITITSRSDTSVTGLSRIGFEFFGSWIDWGNINCCKLEGRETTINICTSSLHGSVAPIVV